jgi:hypothetical protein
MKVGEISHVEGTVEIRRDTVGAKWKVQKILPPKTKKK